MRITFISNYLTHHQIPFSDKMNSMLGNKYTFISTEEMDDERKSMGWSVEKNHAYELPAYKSKDHMKKAYYLAYISDAVIIGSAKDTFLLNRLKENKVTLKISERLYKKGLTIKNYPRSLISSYIHHGRFQGKPLYMLCASAYTAFDVSIFGNYKSKTYKWGYFPFNKTYDINNLISKRNKTKKLSLLWTGRFIDSKHAEDAIYLAKKLDLDGHDFVLRLIGNGRLRYNMKKLSKELLLENKIIFLDPMKPEKIRKYMEETDIYLLTSDFNEGWGAVINEAMNSGCAVVASHAAGSVPFLIQNEKNGLIYRYGDHDSLYNKVRSLFVDSPLRIKLGINAYNTINSLWNAGVAAERLIVLIEELIKNKRCDKFISGPCSTAEIIKNNWID